jgi:hypothetical protein
VNAHPFGHLAEFQSVRAVAIRALNTAAHGPKEMLAEVVGRSTLPWGLRSPQNAPDAYAHGWVSRTLERDGGYDEEI